MGSRVDDSRTEGIGPGESGRVLQFSNLVEGTLFAGRYRLGPPIGAGGGGEVFRAVDEVTGLPVALKVLFPGAGQADLARLKREIQLVRGISHPGILKVFDIGSAEGLLFLVSELLQGESLGSLLQREGPLPPARAAALTREILEALAAAHAAGVVHRDLKPGNIFLDRRGPGPDERVVLLDFGLARPVAGPALTTVGRFVGTPEYCSPEQVRGAQSVGPAADLYSCGVILWEMLAGSPPFAGDSEVDILTAHLNSRPTDRAGALRRTPWPLKDLAHRLLEKNPARRPGAPQALQFLGRPPSRLGALGSLARRLSRHPRPAAGIIAVLALAGFGAVALLRPAGTTANGTLVLWTTVLGTTFTPGPFPRKVAASALDPWSRGIYVGLEETPPVSDPASAQRSQPVIMYQAGPFSRPRALWSDSDYFFYRNAYPGLNTVFQIRELIPLGGKAAGSGPLLAVSSRQNQSFPFTVDFFRGNRRLGWFLHPGYLVAFLGQPEGEVPQARLYCLGYNNHAALHHAVMGLPGSVEAEGQAPPFRAPLTLHGRAGGWYTFLPFRGEGTNEGLRLAGGSLEARYGGGGVARLRASDGLPLEAASRGGLSPDEWLRRRKGLIDALHLAAKEEQAGKPEQGAAALEDWAEQGGGGPEMFSIARFRAAQLRQLSAGRLGRAAYQAALADILLSRASEPAPARARLLHAEILARLGRREECAAVIAGWGRQREEEMYIYEWFLAGWLAGFPSTPQTLKDFWNAKTRPERGWALAVHLADAYKRRDFAGQEQLKAAFTNTKQVWDIHFYWLARGALERPEPRPDRALAYLAQAERGEKQGWFLPLATGTALAEALSSGRPLPPARIAAVSAEIAALREQAFHDLHSRVLLPLAGGDLLRLAAIQNDPALAEKARALRREFPLERP